MRRFIVIAALAALCGCSYRDQSAQDYREKMQVGAEFAEDLGLDFEGVIIFGDGHLGGQAFNLSGLHGYAKISGKPHSATTQPVVR